MLYLDLTNSDLKCQIDNEDFLLVKGLSWRLKQSGFNQYVCASKREGNQVRTIRLHRLLWEIHFEVIPEGYEIHHKDTNILNNQLNNLESLEKKKHRRLHLELLKKYTN